MPRDRNLDQVKCEEVLAEAKKQIEALKQELEQLITPPLTYGVFAGFNPDGTVNIYSSGRKMKVGILPALKNDLKIGQEVVLNEALIVIGLAAYKKRGRVVDVVDLFVDGRIKIRVETDEEEIAERAGSLSGVNIKVGDKLLYDSVSGYLLEILPKSEVKEYFLEQVPDISFEDVGGLEEQVKVIHDALILPHLHPALFEEFKAKPPKGILLYGPPGCGKTLLAKATANMVLRKFIEKTGRKEMKVFFYNIQGPEILNKYVGETERVIREIFQSAKEKGQEGNLSVIFFDEMDSLFRTRGMGISSDMESTIVPQFLSELDGIEVLKNVIVIGASNRDDLIDPAVLRPGRMDKKIRVDRPTKAQSEKILAIYLKDVPVHPRYLDSSHADFKKGDYEIFKSNPAEVIAKKFVLEGISHMISDKWTYKTFHVSLKMGDSIFEDGSRESIYFRDLISGAAIETIVAESKIISINRYLEKEKSGKGLLMADLHQAIDQQIREQRDYIKNIAADPNQQAKIFDRKDKRLIRIEPALAEENIKSIETVPTGHYL